MIQRIENYNTTVLFSTTPPVAKEIQVDDFETVYENTLVAKDQETLMCSEELEAIFEKASKTYNISIDLLKAVAKAESDFNPQCTSSSGAMGIMQLMPETAKELGVTDAYNPEQNIMGGAKYLSENLKIFKGDLSLSVAAYNAGRGAVKKYDGIPPYKETQNYVKKVLGFLKEDIDVPDITLRSEIRSEQSSDTTSITTDTVIKKQLSNSAKEAIEILSASTNTGILSRLDYKK